METTKSADGTVIAYDRAGEGPPLIVAVGAFCDRRSFVPPAGLTERFTVYTYDRRGRGDSGDTQPYSPDLELADLAAVVAAAVASSAVASSAVASSAVASSAVYAFGHSSGGALVLRAAAHGVPLTAVASYEAPFVVPGTREVAQDPADRIREMVAGGRRRAARGDRAGADRILPRLALPAPPDSGRLRLAG